MAIGSVPTEVEAKLLVPDERVLRALARLRHVSRYPLHPRGVARIHSTYVDTAELTLVRHGVALRVRSIDGKWEMTAKWGGNVVDTVHERAELTVPLTDAPSAPFALPPGPLHEHLNALVAARPLQAILVTEISRRLFDVLSPKPSGPTIAELALDRVRLRAAPGQGEAAAAYLELEIELRKGTPRDLAAIVRVLRSRFALMPSTQSKFARGMALVHGPGIPAVREPGKVESKDDAGGAVRKVLWQQLERLRQHDPGARSGDADALHDMRVASRRARAAVRVFGEGLPDNVRRQLAGELKWIGGLLGAVRDLDVQMANLERYVEAAPADHAPALRRLQQYLSTERSRRRRKLVHELDGPRYLDLLKQLEALTIHAPVLPPPHNGGDVAEIGRRAIRRAYRGIVKRGRRIASAPDAEDLHALRIRSKRLRYLLEFLRELTTDAGKRLIKHLVRLQDILGAHQDAIVAADVVRDYVRRRARRASPSSLVALDALVGFELRAADRTREELEHGWERFTNARATTDLEAVLTALEGGTLAAANGQP